MTLDQAHKTILSYTTAVGNDDWLEAIAQIKLARLEAAFDEEYADDRTVSREHARFYFNKGVEYATATD
jgi:hypothetical protein